MKVHPALSALLAPAAAVYGAVVARRLRQYASGGKQPARLQGVVISVGNLTVGGTGKTPMVIYLMRHLQKLNRKAAVLTRGYKSRARATAPGTHGPVSDEVLLLAAALGDVRIGSGPNRFAMGQSLQAAGFDWFVLDDGFQHVQLARDVDILLIDGTVPLAGARTLPAGAYREPLGGMSRANIIVITRSSGDSSLEAEIRRYTNAPVFYAQTALQRVVRMDGGQSMVAGDDWKRRTVFAFCGIGNPGGFYSDLARWGAQVAGRMSFRDHHAFTPGDVGRVQAAAVAAGASALICTDKDRVNLDSAGPFRMPLYVCEADLLPADEDAFWRAVRGVLARKRPEVTL